MLRKTFLSLTLAATVAAGSVWMPSVAHAGEYDGLWISDAIPGFYWMVREDQGVLVAVGVGLDPERLPQLKPGQWEAQLGTLTGATATTTTVIGESVSNSTATFTSPTTGTVIINSCAPADLCTAPVGVPFEIRKIL